MKSIGLTAATAVIAASALVGTAYAHHSNAHFDQESPIVVEGEVVEYHLINPHAFIYVNVDGENGETVEWALQTGGNVGRLLRANWSQDSMATGDVITATLAPMRDGTPGGLLVDVTLADGTRLSAD